MSVQSEAEQYQNELIKIREEIEKGTGKTAKELYDEREQRVRDAIEMRVPDRVPFAAHIDTQKYTGVKNSAGYYDPIAFKRAMRKITLDFEPDMCNAGLPSSGESMELLDVQNRLWPGGPLPDDYDYQFVEHEFMKADEYDMFLTDPSGFMIRRFLPRMYGTLKPLEKLPPLDSMFMGFEFMASMFNTPEFMEMAARIAEAGKKSAEFRKAIGDSYGELANLGFPPFTSMVAGSVGGAPFDTLSSFLRGMQGSMIDMFRRPEKLLQACDAIIDRRIATAIPVAPAEFGTKRIGMPLWRGDKSFMSEAQFDRFYWPGLKKALQASINLGLVPIPFFEAEFGDRLERLLELPAGKVVASIEAVDAVKAKEILGNHTCLYIRSPLSSKVWSLNDLETYTKELIDKCGKGGGLLLDIRLPDSADRDSARAMFASLNEYSRY